jgi:hypothetical protein
MRCSIAHKGVTVGGADVPAGEFIVADFEPAQAYSSIRPIVREGSESLWAMGFSHPEGTGSRISLEALTRAAALHYDLMDPEGRLIPTDFINIIEWPSVEARPVAVIRLRHAHSGVASVVTAPPGGAGAHNRS